MSFALFQLSIVPITLAALALLMGSVKLMRRVIAFGLWVQLALAVWVFLPVLQGSAPSITLLGDDFMVQRLGAYFLLLTTFVVACAITHADHYFAFETVHPSHGPDNPFHVRWFYFVSMLFLMAMCAVFLCNNLGLLWIGVEATTLFSAPLVYFDRTKNALEATWKYLIICSVGIGLALLGVVFIFASSQHGALADGSLNFTELLDHAKELNYSLLRLGFIFCLLGFGTKAGVFPLHSWLPDAHSEAPAPASAMLSGSLLNCALYGIWRVSSIVVASGHQAYITQLVVFMGALTVVAASLFLIRQHSFKRLWAYSSIKNVGIIMIAIGLGSAPLFFCQALNHSIAKVALFLLAGNIVQACGAKRLHQLHGVMKSSPTWGCLLTLASFAVSGMPPFGSFVTEIAILTKSADLGAWGVVWSVLIAFGVALIAISTHIGRILFGGPKPNFQLFQPVRASLVPGALVFGSLIMGIMARPDLWMVLK